MPIFLGDRVIHRAQAFMTWHRKTGARGKSINTTRRFAGKSNSTDLTDHGVPIPSADSNS